MTLALLTMVSPNTAGYGNVSVQAVAVDLMTLKLCTGESMLDLFPTVQSHVYDGESIFPWNYLALLLKKRGGLLTFDLRFQKTV